MAERALDGGEVVKNIGVVEFEIVEDGDFREVMDEFAALVEKRRVIFVPFDDKPLTVSEPRALAQIVRDAADEIARIQAVVFEDPGEQRGRRGFAVRSADHKGASAADEKLLEQFWQ